MINEIANIFAAHDAQIALGNLMYAENIRLSHITVSETLPGADKSQFARLDDFLIVVPRDNSICVSVTGTCDIKPP